MDYKTDQLDMIGILSKISQDWLIWLYENQEVKFVSEKVEAITGYTKEEFLKVTDFFKKIIHPDDRDVALEKLKNEFNNPKPCSFDFRIIHKNGHTRWIHHSCMPIFKQSGKIIGRVISNLDITEKKLTEQILEEKEQINTLINSSPDIICFKDGQGRWLAANKADLELFDLQNIDYQGKKDSELAKYSPFYYDAFMTCEDTDEIAWQKGTLSRSIEIIPKPDGSEKVYEVIKVPIFYDDGTRKGLVVLGHDITQMKKAEEKLRASENRFRAILKTLPDFIFVINDQMQFTDCFAPDEEKLLMPWKNVIGKFIKEALPEYLIKPMKELVKKTFTEKKLHVCEYPLTINDKTSWFEVRMFPYTERKVLSIVRDITIVKEKEEELKKSEQKYREILHLYRLIADNIPDLVWAKDINGKYLFANKAICEKLLIAKDVNEPIGKNNLYFAERQRKLHPERKDWHTFGELCVNSDEIVLKNKKPQRFDEYGNVQGKFLYLDVYKAPLFDENGKLIGTVGHGRIVTKEKEIEKKLKESEKRYRRIFEESQDVIFISSIDGKILDINPAGVQLFGYDSKEEMLHLDITKDLYVDKSMRQEVIENLKRDGYVKDMELRLKRKDGKEIIVLESSTAIRNQKGEIIGISGILRDITEKKMLEAQLLQAQKMESIGILAGGIAHDFNNLLTIINGFSEMALMEMSPDNKLHSKLTSILKAGKRAESLTRQLLAFSRKQIYKPEIVNINHVIETMNKMLRRLLGEDIHIEMVLGKDLPNIKADVSQLEQIFINLVVNARDALRAVKKPNFKKRLTIETGLANIGKKYVNNHPDIKEGEYIFFAVSDNGIGIDKKIRDRIFEPFFTTKEKYEGTGLGLSMVYGIVKQNQGGIYLYSEPGQGTTFKIYWPTTHEEAETKETILKNEILYGNETILLVEDEEEVLNFASESLVSAGYTVFKAGNGRIALELIQKEKIRPDLIITDLIMPEMNGNDLIKAIEKFYPDIKVIYVSGYTDNHIVHNGLLKDGINFLHKPYSINKLLKSFRDIHNQK